MLGLVPDVPRGRWLCAIIIFGALLTLLVIAERMLAATGFDTYRVFAWPPALFFCAIVAYIVPVFHYVTMRTDQAAGALAGYLDISPDELTQVRQSIYRKRWPWHVRVTVVSIACWLLQSWLLAGGWRGMTFALQHSLLSFLMAVMPLLVWLTLSVATTALTDNAKLFRRLTAHIRIDLLDAASVAPVGTMAVHSTLVVIGALALFPIMWVSGPIDAWTTTPGVLLLSIVVVVLVVVPLWPLRTRLRDVKRNTLYDLQQQINDRRSQLAPDAVGSDEVLQRLLNFRREITAVNEWPVDVGALTRLFSYAVIVPLTWIGAALIEMMVDHFLS